MSRDRSARSTPPAAAAQRTPAGEGHGDDGARPGFAKVTRDVPAQRTAVEGGPR